MATLNLPLYVYLPTFYATGLGLDLTTVGAMLLLARLVDMVLDPVMGELGDRTVTRWGARRPWIVAVTPLLLVATWRLFVPPSDAGAFYLLAWSCIAYVAWTILLLAYAAWGAELSGQYHERTRITAAREGCVILGIIAAAALPAVLGLPPGSGEALHTLFWITLVALPLTLALLLWRVGEPRAGPQEPLAWGKGLRIVWGNEPFRRLIAAYFLNSLANGLPATLFLLFVQHVLAAPGSAGLLLLVYFGSGLIAVPGWLWLSYRLGKHRTWTLSLLWACLVFAAVPLLGPGDVFAFAVICCLSGLSLGADLALPGSMQADVVDLDRSVSGRRRTGFFFALWSMATKLSLALAVGIAFPTLTALGFDPAASNGAGALAGLALLYSGLPVLLKLAAVALMWRFGLDAARQTAIRSQLEAS